MIKLGRAFAALGCKPEYTAQEIDQWLDTLPKKDTKTEQTEVSESKEQTKESVNIITSHPRKLPIFSGGDSSKEVKFAQWKFEVKCLMIDPTQSEALVLQSIRSSLKGTAADVLLHLGERVSISDVLDKFEVVFGDVLSSEQLLEYFYSAKQETKESVALWGCRLEELLDKAQQAGGISKEAAISMLRSKFWSGISDQNLKAALRHHYDGGENYGELFRHARAIETELIQSQKVKCNQISQPNVPNKESQLDSILAELKKLGERVGQIEARRNSGFQRKCFGCGSVEHMVKNCPNKTSKNEQGPQPRDG